MDPLTLIAGVAAIAGAGTAWRMRHRACRAEIEVTHLRAELRAEQYAASHDALTGLPNRRAFYQLGAAIVADPSQHPLCAVVVDLDDFKQINDRYGHAAGDEVLINVGWRFARYAGEDLVARLGGDEFVGLLTAARADPRWTQHSVRRLAELFAAPIRVAGRELRVTASIGMVPVCGRVQLAEVLRHADAAMYRVKNRRVGGGCRSALTADEAPP